MKSEDRITLLFAIALAALVSESAVAQDKPAPKQPLAGPALEKAMDDYNQKMKVCTAAREKHRSCSTVPRWAEPGADLDQLRCRTRR